MSDPDPKLNSGEDPLTSKLAAAFGGLELAAQALGDRAHEEHRYARQGERTRVNLELVHGLWSMWTGVMFAANTSAGLTGVTWAFIRLIPGSPYSLGGLLFLGGLILTVGAMKRWARWEITGLALSSVFYALAFLSYLAVALNWMYLGMPRDSIPALQTHGVYGHLGNLLLIHLLFLAWVRRVKEGEG